MNILATLHQIPDVSQITDKTIRMWLVNAHNAIAEQAKTSGIPLKEYACTLIGAIIDDKHAVYFQIGDGGMVIRTNEKYGPYSGRNRENMQTRRILSRMMHFWNMPGSCALIVPRRRLPCSPTGYRTLCCLFPQKKRIPDFSDLCLMQSEKPGQYADGLIPAS